MASDAEFDKKMRRELTIGVLVIVAIMAGLVIMAMWADSVTCLGRWRDSGVEVEWSPVACRVRPPGQQWMPEERYMNFKEIK